MGVNKERVELWCRELESGDYIQVTGVKHGLAARDGIIVDAYCALGVAELIAMKHVQGDMRIPALSPGATAFYGFDSWDPVVKFNAEVLPGYDLTVDHASVSSLNDSFKKPLWDIAQAIRATYLKDDDVHGN